jgi:transcriptional regulator with XRE-family HTH domain
MKREGDPADFGLLVGILRSIRHWTQAELATAAGVDRASISDYERGLKTPSRKTLEKIVAAVGVPFARVERLLPILRSLRLSREEAVGAAGGNAAAPAPEGPAALAQAVAEIAAAELAAAFLEIPALAGTFREESPLEAVCARLREESAREEAEGTGRGAELAVLATRLAQISS